MSAATKGVQPVHTPSSTLTTQTIRSAVDMIFVDPSDVSDPSEVLHIVDRDGPDGEDSLEALCGERLMRDDPDAFRVDFTAAGRDEAPAALTMMCARCTRVREMVRRARQPERGQR